MEPERLLIHAQRQRHRACSTEIMRPFLLVSAAGAALLIYSRSRRREIHSGSDHDPKNVEPGSPVELSRECLGIAEVDPQPMTQTAGEGIDLEANEAAHEDRCFERP